MRIRIINEKDWEKSYELDKSIIRVGSQITCDIMISDPDVPPLMMQITRSGTIDIRNTMRFFTENITLTRGDQTFPPDMNMPYEVLDGDKINFSRYRMIIELESDKSRVRQTEHMRAEMFLSDRDLAPDSPISGGLLLKNLGTQRPCQFRLNIKGIPAECLYSSPLPYLHPGASSSVGFTISHLKTRPAPGFHTVSITLSAPDDYYGEMLEFNQDIYVYPVFDNVMILEDDTDKLSGMVRKDDGGKENPLPEPVTVQPDMSVRDSGMMNLDESVFASNASPETSVRVVAKGDNALNTSFDDEEDEEELPGYRKKKNRVVVIRGNEENLFDGESPEELQPEEEAVPETDEAEAPFGEMQADAEDSGPGREEPSSQEEEPAPAETSAENQPQPSEPSDLQKEPEPENAVVPEEPQVIPSPRKKPVKFKPDEVVVFSGKNDAFDEEPSPEEQAPAAEPASETVKDLEAVPPEKAEPAPEEKPRTKNSAKTEMSEPEAEAVPLAKPENEKSILVLESSPAEHEDPKKTVLSSVPTVEERLPDEEQEPLENIPEGVQSPVSGEEAEAAPSEEPEAASEKKQRKKSPANEQINEENAPVGEPSAEEQVPEEESDKETDEAPDDDVKPAAAKKPRKKSTVKEQEIPNPEEEPSAEETAPAEEPADGEQIPEEKPATDETAPAEEPLPDEQTPVKKPRKKSSEKEQKIPQPDEEPSAEETAPAEKPAAGEQTPEEKPSADETAPVEEPLPDEQTPAKKPRKKSAAKEREIPQPEAEPSPEDKKSAEETVPEETPAAEELIAEETPPAEESSAEGGGFMEEHVPEETLPAEESAAEEVFFAGEQIPEEEPKAENPSPEKAPQVPVFRHSDGFDEFSAEEADDPYNRKGKPSETEQVKPAIRVVKGGSFD